MEKKPDFIKWTVGLIGFALCIWFLLNAFVDKYVSLSTYDIATIETNGVRIVVIGPAYEKAPPEARVITQYLHPWRGSCFEITIPFDDKNKVMWKVDPNIILDKKMAAEMILKFNGIEPWIAEIKKVFLKGAEEAIKKQILPGQVPANFHFDLSPNYHQQLADLGCSICRDELPKADNPKIIAKIK